MSTPKELHIELFDIKTNVKSYENNINFHHNYRLEYWYDSNTLLSESDNKYYFLIDTLYSSVFAHWVYECAIFLPYFKELKKIYPQLKIVFKEHRFFKELFLDYFEISKDDYFVGTADIEIICGPSRSIQNISVKNNTCIIPKPIARFNDPSITQEYKILLTNFFQYFRQKSCAQFETQFLLMERGSKENYTGFDRKINFDSIREVLDTKKLDYLTYNSDNTVKLIDQIKLVNNTAKNIIIVDGSAYQVNGMFMTDRNIHIINSEDFNHNMTKTQEIFLKYKFLHECIENINGNKVFYYNQTNPITDYLKSIRNLSYVSNNCIGALTFKHFEQKYNNPFISHLILDDFKWVNFCKNYDEYMLSEPKIGVRDLNSLWCKITKKEKFDDHDYPVLLLSELELHFIHDNHEQKLLETFKRRQERYLKDPLITTFFLFNSFTLFQDHSLEEYEKLLTIFLQHKHYSIALLPNDLPDRLYNLFDGKRNVYVKMNESFLGVKRNPWNYNLQDTPDKRLKFIELLGKFQ